MECVHVHVNLKLEPLSNLFAPKIGIENTMFLITAFVPFLVMLPPSIFVYFYCYFSIINVGLYAP